MTDQDNPPETKPNDAAQLPPGRGSPIMPGAPMSVGPPMPARAFNLAALVWVAVAGVALIVVVVVLAALLHR